MKVTKIDAKEASKQIAETPKRVLGEWKALLAELVKSKEGAKVTELTRGQVAALIRQGKADGFSCVAVDKYTSVILSPPEAKKPVAK